MAMEYGSTAIPKGGEGAILANGGRGMTFAAVLDTKVGGCICGDLLVLSRSSLCTICKGA